MNKMNSILKTSHTGTCINKNAQIQLFVNDKVIKHEKL